MQTAYRALSDPTRREILWLLYGGPRRFAEIATGVEVPAASVTRHLGLLTAAGLVQVVGEVYVLRTSVLADIVFELAELAGIGTDASRADLIEGSDPQPQVP